MTLTKTERQRRETGIIELRNQGRPNREIAIVLGLPVSIISTMAHELIKKGMIAPQLPGRPIDSAFWHNLQDERVQTIIRMVKERATLQQIGDAIGYTREAARQIIAKLKSKHGNKMFALPKDIWSSQEAADELGVSINTISRICHDGQIPVLRRGVDGVGGYLLDKKGMCLLRLHPLITHKRECIVCGKTFVYDQKSRKSLSCPGQCSEDFDHQQKERERQRFQRYANSQPTFDSLDEWHQDLLGELQAHQIPKNDERITITEAVLRTGLNSNRLHYLGWRNIVLTWPHSYKKGRGGGLVRMYSASQMEIVKRVFETHQRKKSAKT